MLSRFPLALAALVPTVHAGEPLRLAPSSPWVVDYGENSCRLIRTFGADRQQVKLAFESDAPDELDLIAIGRPLWTYNNSVVGRFMPAGGRTFRGDPVQTVDKGVAAVLFGQVPLLPDQTQDALEKEARLYRDNPSVRPPGQSVAEREQLKAQRYAYAAAATEIVLQAGPSRRIALQTGSLEAPIKAFDECSRLSLKDWGVDADLEDRIVRPVFAPSRRGWLTSDDYPKAMANKGEEAAFSVRLLVDATGRPTKCTSISHFREKSFDEISCARIMERARFLPAELADGTKVPSYYVTRIVFRMGV